MQISSSSPAIAKPECFLTGSSVYSSKRGRPQYSSLIPFPRVGRSTGNSGSGSGTRDLMYYGQKRGGKSGLIPFPRVGRGGGNTWDMGEEGGEGGPGRYEEEERGEKNFDILVLNIFFQEW